VILGNYFAGDYFYLSGFLKEQQVGLYDKHYTNYPTIKTSSNVRVGYLFFSLPFNHHYQQIWTRNESEPPNSSSLFFGWLVLKRLWRDREIPDRRPQTRPVGAYVP
jgi:hypothetical protein